MEPRIKALSADLVAKIAAGEVINSPLNVVKELIENSLDAKATLIHISIKEKGTVIKIRDNGIGFNRDDLPLACLRHTTSKLSSMSDFETLENYGFRGEALSSISQVADVTIVTKRRSELMGAEAKYRLGEMISCKNKASNDGTVILIENLFYNLKDRLDNLKSTFTKEYNKIVDVIQCYSIHCNYCSFNLEKDSRTEVVSNVNSSKAELVKTVLGRKVASNLLELKHENSKYEYSLEGLISNTHANLNRYFFILFINNRLVDCSSLRTTIKEIFSDQLMKGNNPFVYLNLKISQKNLDVNLHPSKREVRYLNEDVINREISQKIQQCLIDKAENQDILKLNTSYSQMMNKSTDSLNNSFGNSSFIDQSRSTPKAVLTNQSANFYNRSQPNSDSKATKKATAAYKIIRNDPTSKKVSDMFAVKNMTERDNYHQIRLKSVLELRKEIDDEKDVKLTYQIRRITLVGVLDHRRILIQHEEFMNILDFVEFSKHFLYQSYLMNFGNFKSITFSKDLHLIDLLKVFNDKIAKCEEFKYEDNIISLIDNREMFYDYFSLQITEEGFLKSIPLIIDGHKPNLNLLPVLIWNLTAVDFSDEKKCFKSIGHAFASYYCRPLDKLEDQKKNVENIFSRFKEQFKPKSILNDFIIPIANLQSLYKIFERC